MVAELVHHCAVCIRGDGSRLPLPFAMFLYGGHAETRGVPSGWGLAARLAAPHPVSASHVLG